MRIAGLLAMGLTVEGVLLGRWVSAVEPDGAEITAAIEAALVEAP